MRAFIMQAAPLRAGRALTGAARLCSALALTALSAAAQAEPPRLDIAQGRLVGLSADGVDSFLGIPYAAAPVGDRRWRPPASPERWSGTRDASVAGNECPQPTSRLTIDPSGRPQSEDCLYLNVWTPSERAADLPVLVWIHGGGFVAGTGARGMTQGTALARRGLVVVSLNYRLGRLGFFAHPLLTAENPDGLLANYGLQDQLAALRWVKQNIRSFGGDPANVTLMGESAGGASVNHLIASPLARGLFHKAIVQSGGGRVIPPAVTVRAGTARQPGERSAESIGEQHIAAQGLAPATAAELRALPLDKLALPYEAASSGSEQFPGVVIDGKLVRHTVAEAFARGDAMPVPYLVGATDAEALLAMTPSMLETALTAFGEARQAVTAAYGGDGARLLRELGGDIVFTEPARHLARQMRLHGAPVWMYRFGYLARAAVGRLAGVPHGYSLPYFFDRMGATGLSLDERDLEVAATMADYVTAFARHGDPNAPGRPRWSPYGTSELLLSVEPDRIETRPDQRSRRLDLIEGLATRLGY